MGYKPPPVRTLAAVRSGDNADSKGRSENRGAGRMISASAVALTSHTSDSRLRVSDASSAISMNSVGSGGIATGTQPGGVRSIPLRILKSVEGGNIPSERKMIGAVPAASADISVSVPTPAAAEESEATRPQAKRRLKL